MGFSSYDFHRIQAAAMISGPRHYNHTSPSLNRTGSSSSRSAYDPPAALSMTRASSSSLATEMAASGTPRASPRTSLDILSQVSIPNAPPDVSLPTTAGPKRRSALVKRLSRGYKKPLLDYQQTLAQATLSSPELHLSSDPLLDSENLEYPRLAAFPVQADDLRSPSPSITKRKSATDWLRSRKWSAALIGRVSPPTTAASRSSAARASSRHKPTGTDLTLTGPADALHSTMDRMRAARKYLLDELGQLSVEQLGWDQERVSELSRTTLVFNSDDVLSDIATSQELWSFWTCINSGVLLCLLVNHLKPGVIDRIDRRDIEWVRADNLSRFLRAARDFFAIRSRDLFHPLDLTEATVEGLQRAIHTILAIRDHATEAGLSTSSPSLPISSTIIERIKSKRKSLSTPLRSPGQREAELPNPDQRFSVSSTSSAELSLGEGSESHAELTVAEHRRAAEAKLTQGVWRPSDPISIKRSQSGSSRSSQPSSPMHYSMTHQELQQTRSITLTLAQDSGPDLSYPQEGTRFQPVYRDRKQSESALSLRGVAEEETEDIMYPTSASTEARSYDPLKAAGKGRAPSPRSGMYIGRPSVVSRTHSQHRIGREIALAQQGSPDLRKPRVVDLSLQRTGSPAVPRRHSGRSAEASRTGQPPALSQPAVTALAAQVPFPRCTETGALHETGSSSLLHPPLTSRRASTQATTTTKTDPSTSVSWDSDRLQSTSFARKTPVRPAYKPLPYSSDLHLPATPPSIPRSVEVSSLSPTSDQRTSSGVTSQARLSTDTAPSEFQSPNSSSAEGRAVPLNAPSRHKITLTEEGNKSTTFQMGNCIGRGQFGSVYRALNLSTGQMVAVKRIKIEGRSEAEVTQLMKEVDLLKRLHHPSVVKYEGLVRGTDAISIILEYVENGSLLHTLKAFGHLPEQLVASYVVKILEGLVYLHEMEVVHCDLKAANILTTKNGNVKLSDFGVSLNLQAMEKVQQNDAIGTPNWMAPEVIELQGASTAADIWSLGCTIIELLTGKPPYSDMLAMSAMFRIVEDERPPIPEKCSEELRDFLTQCFRKNPKQRPNAAELFKHPWLASSWGLYKEARSQDSLPFLKRISSDAGVAGRGDVRNLYTIANETEESTVAGPTEGYFSRPRAPLIHSQPSSRPGGELWTPLRGNSNASPVLSFAESDLNLLRSATRSSHRKSDISCLDLSSTDDSHAKHSPQTIEGQITNSPTPHRFVKSTFSREIRCKLCLQNVRKHAVFCEDCGLMCHARCARDTASVCDVRAQVLLLQRQEQGEPGTSPSEVQGQDALRNHESALSLAEVSMSEMASCAAGLFAARLKHAIARSRRISMGQRSDSFERRGASSPDPSGGIEKDSPVMSIESQVGAATAGTSISDAKEVTTMGTAALSRKRAHCSSPDTESPSSLPFSRSGSATSTGVAGAPTKEEQVESSPEIRRVEPARPRPTHRVSHSTGDLVTLQGLNDAKDQDVKVHKTARHVSPTPPASAHSGDPYSGLAYTPLSSQRQRLQHENTTVGPSTLGDKWRSRRTSMGTRKKEDCTIM